MEDFIDSIQYYGLSARIKRLSDTLNNESRKMNAFLGFDTEPNWHLIFLLLKNESLPVTEIARRLQFSHPAVVKIIKKMKERGYIYSVQDEHDSRKQHLSLTEKSKALLPKFEEGWTRIQAILKECTTPDFLSSIEFFENNIKSESIIDRLKKTQS